MRRVAVLQGRLLRRAAVTVLVYLLNIPEEKRGVRAIYNKAEYAEQRRTMLQTWADMLDGWIQNAGNVVPIRQQATRCVPANAADARGKVDRQKQ